MTLLHRHRYREDAHGTDAGRFTAAPALDATRSVAILDARNGELWSDIARHRFGSLFSSPPWIEAVGRTYDFEILASAQMRAGRIDAALPFSHVRDLRGSRVVCLPFSDYCDPLVEDAETWMDLIAPVLALNAPVSLRCLRNTIPAQDARFKLRARALWHGVDLTKPEDELWAGLTGSARQNVRKAQRANVVVRAGRALEDVRLFHRMHCHLRKVKYRLLGQPMAFFENLYELFAPGGGITVLLAERDGTPLAGILFLEWNGTLYYKFNASLDPEFRPNDLLAWHGILLGRERGLARLDFGLSDVEQPGLVRYKRKFATEEREISLLQWRPEAYADPRGEQAGRTLGRVTRLLTDPTVPDEIARAAGDELYRFFC
jgi:CelD/BcsL family acetyltransferase involved in cellulose biosynthesis